MSEVNEDIIYNYFDYIAPKIQYESIFRLLSPLLNIFFGIPDSKKFKSEIHTHMKKQELSKIKRIFIDFVSQNRLLLN